MENRNKSLKKRIGIASAIILGTTFVVYLLIAYFKIPAGAGLPFLLISVVLTSFLFETKGGLIIALVNSIISFSLVLLYYQIQYHNFSQIKYLPTIIFPTLIYFISGFGIGKVNEMRRKYEEKLKESEEKFRNLVEGSLVGVYIIQDNKFRFINKKLAEIFGYTREEMMKIKVSDTVAPEDRKLVKENIRKRIAGEIPSLHYTFKALKKNGEKFDLEVFGSRIVYQGKPAVQGTAIDVTEKKKAEEELKKAHKELQTKYDELKRFERLTVGRELKMIELKKKIKKLEERLKSK